MLTFPANPGDPRNCEVCHEQNTGAEQATAFLTPNRAACGACHDDVNFATGENHANLPQVTDNQCSNCHTPQGELPFDVSIMGAHTNPTEFEGLPGLVITIVKVDDGSAGKKPAITFTLKDKGGNPLAASSLVGGTNRLAAVLAGPTTRLRLHQLRFGRDHSRLRFRGCHQGDLRHRWNLRLSVPACHSRRRQGHVLDRHGRPARIHHQRGH